MGTPRCPRAAAKLPTWAVQASIGQGRRQSYQLGRCKRQSAKGGGAVPENTSLPKGGGKATNLGGASVNWPRGAVPENTALPKGGGKATNLGGASVNWPR